MLGEKNIRRQIVVPQWLDDYVKHVAEKWDASYSGALRFAFCAYHYHIACKVLNKKDKDGTANMANIAAFMKDNGYNMEIAEQHALIGDLYFKARKVFDEMYELDKRSKKNG